jgi:hypothetical protein
MFSFRKFLPKEFPLLLGCDAKLGEIFALSNVVVYKRKAQDLEKSVSTQKCAWLERKSPACTKCGKRLNINVFVENGLSLSR